MACKLNGKVTPPACLVSWRSLTTFAIWQDFSPSRKEVPDYRYNASRFGELMLKVTKVTIFIRARQTG
ncbi:hypothetical protein PGTUg99_034903 [Puccinia graminis f. sp. tritici]|uniref:Uncharacterized protein n=1 Tax=Puccinia graminis f. sp. tritici TaxID=56615 RepID=A0A5B0QV62_PUCGR|nr:hypothetical protein PGTUg99_034903 [Puccinia graminis f. sp. tritici]